ncbi:hypothetical protein BaRGS_00011674 [Batillaria attramentaria]|uniref:Peroxin-19 n=1 Tax=Batillaria attramentaria TaxID=370345 RepID=A0ABD0LC87_9CAEN
MADKDELQTTCGETSVDGAVDCAGAGDSKENEKSPQEDKELDEILNSALQDFDKNEAAAAQQKAQSDSTNKAEAGAAGGADGASSDPMSAAFAEDFSDQLAAQFEEAMKSFLSQDPRMMEQIEKLAEAAGNAANSPESQQQFASTLSQTLADLTHNAEGLEEQVGEDELSQAFSAMSGEGQGDDFMPMMQGLMQTLLSKEILYPSLKEISAKYPAYLSENESQLEAGEQERYRKQYELMTSICVVFEEEEPEDTPEVKNQRFEKLMDLMQQMQELGQPPKDIVGEMAPGLEFDQNGMPKLPGVGSQCSVM